MIRRILKTLPILLISGFFLGRSEIALAHGYIVRSSPADRAVLQHAPQHVQVWFSEGLERGFSTITVVNQQGERVDIEGGLDAQNTAKLVAKLPPNLPDGAYLVKLRPVFTSDGHGVSDTLVFWVGQPAGDISADGRTDTARLGEVVWRVLLSGALVLLFGLYLFDGLILRPAWGTPPRRVWRWMGALLWGALIVANVSNAAALLQTSTVLFDTSLGQVMREELWNIVLSGTNFGDIWGIRVGVLLLMTLLHAIAAQQATFRPWLTLVAWRVNLGFSAVALLTLSFISHAGGAPWWPVLSLMADFLHLLGVAAWAGGLIVLAVILRPALAPLTPAERGQALLALLKRFSPVAFAAVALIISTGIYIALVQIDQPDKLVRSTYGLTLLSKWALIVPVFVLAALHFVIVSPARWNRLAIWIGAEKRFGGLPATLRLEMLFVVGVLFSAGWLPATPPPIPQNARAGLDTQPQTLDVAGYRVELLVGPAAVGMNSVDVQVAIAGEAATLDQVRVRFSQPTMGDYIPYATLDSTEPGLWVGAGGDLPRSGIWDVLVDIDPPNSAPIRAAFRWDIAAEVKTGNERTPNLLHFMSIGVIALALASTATPPMVRGIRTQSWTPETILISGLALALTIAATVGGAFLFAATGNRIEEKRATPPEIINPVFADADSVDAGRLLYEVYCLACHGEGGRAGRPSALNTSRPIPPLHSLLGQRKDYDLYSLLSQGLVNRHNYGVSLQDVERWQLINYLRTLEI